MGGFLGSVVGSFSGFFSSVGGFVRSVAGGFSSIGGNFLGASSGGVDSLTSSIHRFASGFSGVVSGFRNRVSGVVERGVAFFGGAGGERQGGRSSRSSKSKFDRHVVNPSDGYKSVPAHACPDGHGMSHTAGSESKRLNHCELFSIAARAIFGRLEVRSPIDAPVSGNAVM